MSDIREAKDYLKEWGFPAQVSSDPIHLHRLPEVDSIDWKPFMLIFGDYCTGKTTLAANKLYHDYVAACSVGKHLMMGSRFDTLDLVEILCLADKIGLARACDQSMGGEGSGERLQNDIEGVLECHWGELLILDDFNIDAVSNELQLKKINKVVMARFMQNRPTWLITNETPEALAEVFPRLMSRVDHDDKWAMVEKTHFASKL
ncbi:MAG: hypothetical protein IPK87_00810 [Planctomycetes bacterium]|nr:hypothetical protein [Planctomycetota bacterium]